MSMNRNLKRWLKDRFLALTDLCEVAPESTYTGWTSCSNCYQTLTPNNKMSSYIFYDYKDEPLMDFTLCNRCKKKIMRNDY